MLNHALEALAGPLYRQSIAHQAALLVRCQNQANHLENELIRMRLIGW